MKAILINPYALRMLDGALALDKDSYEKLMNEIFEAAITEVVVDGSLDQYYETLSDEEHRVSTLEAAYFSQFQNAPETEDVAYVDEEGLLYNGNGWVIFRGAYQPFAGRALIVGTTEDGDSCSPQQITLEWVRQNTILVYQAAIFNAPMKQVAYSIFNDGIQLATQSQMCDYDCTAWTQRIPTPA